MRTTDFNFLEGFFRILDETQYNQQQKTERPKNLFKDMLIEPKSEICKEI
jgi:hypothetical protein